MSAHDASLNLAIGLFGMLRSFSNVISSWKTLLNWRPRDGGSGGPSPSSASSSSSSSTAAAGSAASPLAVDSPDVSIAASSAGFATSAAASVAAPAVPAAVTVASREELLAKRSNTPLLADAAEAAGDD